MNWEQLKAIIWLRSRLSLNQWRKGGAVNFVLMMILVVGLLVFAAISFFASVVLGIFLLPQATPNVVMIVWDVMIGVLLFSWLTSLLVEIQRMELLSLEKLLHLPMTLRDAFLLNYLSSIVCLNIVCFVPAAVGLSIALAITKGPQLLFMLPLVISFVLMLTAVTYQLRGWLSSLMSNKRRQRTVVVAITMGFIAFAQLPNVVIQLSVPDGKAKQKQVEEYQKKEAAITELLTKGEITLDEHTRRTADLKAANAEEKARAKAEWHAKGERMLTLCNQVLPVGWLAYASRQLIVGPLWPAFLCFAAMTSIGSLSLWRSYKSTIRFYTGNQVRTMPAAQAAIAPTSDPLAERSNKGNDAQRKPLFVERSLPKVSEHSAAVALTSMQGMLRAPEMKMMLIGPAMLGGTAIFMVATNRIPKIPLGLDPFVWVAGIGVLTFMSMMLMMNIFGMDRNGFRCYVLMPIERSELLIGKNLAVLPIVLSLFVCFAGALLSLFLFKSDMYAGKHMYLCMFVYKLICIYIFKDK